MQRCFDRPEELFPGARPVGALGMFDGVHVGHQAVFVDALRQAEARNQPAVAVTFDTHPRAVVSPDARPLMITSLAHRLNLFEAQGLDGACVLPFDQQVAALSARDFVDAILLGKLRLSALVVGPRAHFGRGREGNVDFLRRIEPETGLPVVEVPPVYVDGEAVSSTAVRDAVGKGELDRAARLLGRPASVLGTVVHGRGVGRTLGFPTLNLDLHHELHPPQGVYLARARCGDTVWNAVANIGRRPAPGDASPGEHLVEAHLLDFSGDLYGQTAEVLFLETLRAEKRFPDLDALRRAIADDVEEARQCFASEHGEAG